MGTFTIHNTDMSYVEISAYMDYTAAQLKARATIPVQNAMIISGTNVKCYKIDTKVIGGILGDPLANIDTLAASAEVNRYSQFSSREWWDNSGTIESRVKASYTKDDFAGYHHDALPPSVVSTNGDIYQGDPSQNTVWAEVYISEIDWAAQLGFGYIRMDIYAGSIFCGNSYVSLDQVVQGVVRIDVTSASFQFISNQDITGKLYFMTTTDDIDDVTHLVPGLPTLTFRFIAQSLVFEFESTDGIDQRQVYTVNTAEDSWDITSKPEWVTCAVYHAGVYDPSGPYVSGDEIRIYPSSANTGLNRTGSILLTEAVQIDVIQQGGTPSVVFSSQSLTYSEEIATLVVDASTMSYSFKVLTGISALDRETITIQLSKDGVGFIGVQDAKNTRAGLTVNGNLVGFVPGDIENGHSYTLHVESFA